MNLIGLRPKILVLSVLVITAGFFIVISDVNAEQCGNRLLLGYADVFWGNPPPTDYYQPTPRPYSNINVGPGDTVRLSLEGEFPENPVGPPDCYGQAVEFDIYRDGSSTPIRRVAGALTVGSSIIPGNLGSYQWYVSWAHDLSNGDYRFRLVKLGGDPLNSALSTNLLVVTGAGAPPINLGNWWCENEGSGWAGIWIRRSSTNIFDAFWVRSGQSDVTATLTMTVNGSNVFIERRNSSDGNDCDYTGSSPDSINVSGTYGPCTRNAGGSWDAVINGSCYTPPTVNIDCNGSYPCIIPYNSSATINWTSTGSARSCSVSPSGWTGLSGSQSTSNLVASTTYTVNCSSFTLSVSDSVTVNVGLPSLFVNLSANPNSGQAPLGVDLTAGVSGSAVGTANYSFWWNCSDTTTSVSAAAAVCGTLPAPSPGSCAFNSSGAKCNASSLLTISQNHIYAPVGAYQAKVIAERGTAFPAQAQVSINVTNPLPVADIQCNSANSCSIVYGSSAILNWTSSNTIGCSVAPGGWTGISNSGQSTGNLTATTTYTLNCTGPGGSVSDFVTVSVGLPPSPTATINCNGVNPCNIAYNSPAAINWSSSNTTSCTVSPGNWTGTSGSQSTGGLTSTTVYILNCTGPGGSASASTTVNVGAPPPPPDSDGDGVPDNVDQCPGTLPGTPVDSIGCPIPPPPAPQSNPFTGISIPNPFSAKIDTFDDLLNAVINFFYFIAGPIVVIMIIVSGLMFLFGRGQPEKVNTAKRVLLWAVVGLVVILIGQGFVKLLESIIALGN